MRKKIKLLSGGILVIAGLVFLAGIILPDLLEEKLRVALIEEFSEQTRQKYVLSLNTIDIALWSRYISADSISVTASSDSGELRSMDASSIVIDGIKWVSLLNQPFPEFRSVTVNKPTVELLSKPISPSVTPKEEDTADSDTDFSTFDIYIKNGSGDIYQQDGAKIFSLGSFDLFARSVNLNTVLKGSYVPFLEDLSFSGKDLKWNLHKQYYTFTIGEFAFNKNDQEGMVKGLRFTPVIEKYRFAEIRGHQLDRFDLKIDSLKMEGLNLDSLALPAVKIAKLDINYAWLEVFHDKHMPPGRGIMYKPLLNKVAHEIGFSFGLDEANISNSTIIYGEHMPESDSAGYISFNNLDATLTGFRSASHPYFFTDTLGLRAKTLFMNTAPLTVNVRYPVFNKQDSHRVQAHLGEMSAKTPNGMLKHVGFVEVESGLVNEMRLDMTLTSELATGKMWLDYTGLKVNILDKANPGNSTFKTKFASFIANNFVMKSENPSENLRVGEIYFERPRDKAIFGYWWKSVLSGIKSSIK